MNLNPDPLDPLHPQTLARPASTIMARPLVFADPPTCAFDPPHPMQIASISRGQAVMDIALFLGAVALIFGLFAGIDYLTNPPSPETPVATERQPNRVTVNSPGQEESNLDNGEEPREVDLLGTMLTGFIASGLVLAMGRWRGLSLSSVGLPAFSSLDLPLGLAAAAAAFAAHFLGIGITLLTWPNAWELMTESSTNIMRALPPGGLWKYLLIFVAVAFYEELVFRGFLLTRIRRWVGSWWLAVVLSSLCFAVPHVGLQEATALPSLFLLATTFAVFTVLRRSLYPAMIGHWLFNSIMIIFMHGMMNATPSP